jgi:DNA-binding NarL/FixJ family response regulator
MDHITVLIADAHPIACLGIRGVLEEDPCMKIVGEASSVDEVLSSLASSKPNVVVMDDSLDGESSTIWLDEISAASPTSRILIFSSDATKQEPAFAVVHGKISKGQPVSDLLTAVRKAASASVTCSVYRPD